MTNEKQAFSPHGLLAGTSLTAHDELHPSSKALVHGWLFMSYPENVVSIYIFELGIQLSMGGAWFWRMNKGTKLEESTGGLLSLWQRRQLYLNSQE